MTMNQNPMETLLFLAFYGDDSGKCDCDDRIASEMSPSELSDTGGHYMQKLQTPWHLFVWHFTTEIVIEMDTTLQEKNCHWN